MKIILLVVTDNSDAIKSLKKPKQRRLINFVA
jgi:hypothetical protein